MHTNLGRTLSKIVIEFAIALILTTPGWAQATEKVLYSFTDGADGGYPQSGVVMDSKGNLYGTASGGGTGSYCHCGTFFELSPGANGIWTQTTLYYFGSNPSDGTDPYGALVFDPKGNLYGTTLSGGTYQGTVFELSPGSNGSWTEKIIYNFTGGADGGSPYSSGLIIDSAGNLYGTTNGGGAYGFGVVFELVAGSNSTWTEKVLHAFTGNEDGSTLYNVSLVLDRAGNLYGIARQGGGHDYGVVFALVPMSDGGWSEKVIYSFTADNGEAAPTGGLLLDGLGNLYGVAEDVFRLIPGSDGTWTHETLRTFFGPPDGAYPLAGLISDKAGNLYGTTYQGGAHYGTVFELLPATNGKWNEKILHRFTDSAGDGKFPIIVSLTMDASGNLYGTTETGGTSNFGVVFEVTP